MLYLYRIVQFLQKNYFPTALIMACMKAGRSSGVCAVTKFPSTTHLSSDQIPPTKD